MNRILLTAAGNPENQDRGLILDLGSGTLLCVADGAGGLSGGTEAASKAVEFIRKHGADIRDESSCLDAFFKMDAAVSDDPLAGETTCALAVVEPAGIYGASVGDSGVWLIAENGGRLNLTQAQQRKPFVGSGRALPVGYPSGALPDDVTVILAKLQPE